MDLAPLRALACDMIQSAHGVPVTVTRPAPDDTPVVSTGLWYSAPLDEPPPFGVDFQRREPRRVIALPRGTFDSVPRGTIILAPETKDGPMRAWRVDGIERFDPYWARVIVIPQVTP